LEQTDNSKQSVEISLLGLEDIPEALREETSVPRSSSFPFWLLALGGGLIAIAVITTGFFFGTDIFSLSQTPTPLPTPEEKMGPEVPDPFPQPDNLLGHLPYQEAVSSELKPITRDGAILMRKAAAEKFLAMQKAARSRGIILQPLSGFRSLEDQQRLFFEVKQQRGQVVSKRAEVSAPPGYSEHHTGYAIDIGDAKSPSTYLNPAFEKTAAYQWLAKNAAYYSFELSFPKDNLQGVSYEPWHWRFVGDIHSLETFYKAKNLHQSITNQP
jgi:D-alanyl-D-alanine carboxypeptidase